MKGNNLSGVVILSLVIGLIVGFALGVLWQNSAQQTDDSKDTVQLGDVSIDETVEAVVEEQKQTFKTTVSGSGSIAVDDQGAGSSVVVARIEMNQIGWVAIREDVNGQLGNILGAVLVTEGVHENIQVPLLRDTQKEKTYRAVLFGDNGDKLFNHTVDSMLEMNGTVISDSMVTNK